jgi:hypothetical protein
MPMAGYASRKKPSEGVAQRLFAKSLALQDEQGTRLVIVTTDLIGIPRQLRDNLEAEVLSRYQLPREALLLNASHTHCGPEIRVGRSVDRVALEDKDQIKAAYGAELQEKLLHIIGKALENLQPASLDYQHARCGFAMNRRRPTERGVVNSPNSDGPVDHTVPVLRVTDDDEKTDDDKNLVAVLFGYACHNTTLSFYEFCGDYAGYAQEYFEAAHLGAQAMFLTGCGGDQNPYPRGKLELAQTHGRSLACAVDAALDTVPRSVSGPLKLRYELITLKFAPPPSRDELQAMADGTKEPLKSHSLKLLQQLDETGTIVDTYSYPVHVIGFGDDVLLVALAGEVVVDYALRFKRELAGKAEVWMAGYSNDVFGYVPSRRVLDEGGYEGGGAMLNGSLPGPFAADVEDRIAECVLRLAREVASQ